MNFYIAACVADQSRAERLAIALRALGCTITSSWHTASVGSDASLTGEQRLDQCRINQRDLWSADIVVLLWSPQGRGSLVEAGMAMGHPYVRLLCVGDRFAATLMLHNEQWVPSDEIAVEFVRSGCMVLKARWLR